MAHPTTKRLQSQHHKRILFVIGSLDRGGAESQLVMLADRLAQRGWSIAIFVLDKSGPLIAEMQDSRISIFDGGFRSDTRPSALKLLKIARSEWRLALHIVRERPSVVHTFLPLSNFLGSVAATLTRVPVIITSRRGLGKHQDRHPYLRWLDWVANACSHIVTANSHAVAADVERRDGYPASKITVIANGLDFGRFADPESRRDKVRQELGLSDGDVAIVKLANLIPYKGHAELLAAFSILAKNDPRLKLFLIGEDRGVARSLSETATRCGVIEKLVFLGGRSDVPDLLAAMDMGVMASHEEGFSNAMLEKLASGLPVVATDVGGNPEALEGMPDCEIVRPMDPVDLARGLRSVLSRLDDARQNAQERRRLVAERYSVDVMVDHYERLYLSRIQGGGH